MRPIHLARIDNKTQLVLVLTRDVARHRLTAVTVAPITSTIHGLSTEVLVGPENGLDQASAVSCDNTGTIATEDLGRVIGYLHTHQEDKLAGAIAAAFDLDL